MAENGPFWARQRATQIVTHTDMDNTNLFQLIQSFSPVELRDVRRFLHAPFFNQRKDMVVLFEWLCTMPSATKEMTWQHLFGDIPFETQKFRLHVSYLHRLLEQYLIVKESTADTLANQVTLAVSYRKRNNPQAFERVRKTLEKALKSQPLRNAYYHQNHYNLLWESHQHNYTLNPTDVAQLRELSNAADVVYLSQKLRLVCLLAAHQSVYQAEIEHPREKELLAMAERPEYAHEIAITIYVACYRMLRLPDEEDFFQQFKTMLIEQSSSFSAEEVHGLFILAINYCVRKINSGQDAYSREVLELYKSGLTKGYLFENGILRRFTYYNIVAVGLQSNEREWVRYFIHEYKNRLEKKYRESLFGFNLARLEYAYQNYSYVLELLQKVNYRDILLNLSAKTLLLKTYFALGEEQMLLSHLDAMRNYIHRKHIIGYHRTNYLNVVRYMEKFIGLQRSDKAAVAAYRDLLEKEETLSEKKFFIDLLPST
jgi:hypothetical protein